MVRYALDHLVQADNQAVSGPIQDDEALLLFSVIRCMRLQTVVEVGGLSGYSARNFCEAVGPSGKVFTIDLGRVPRVAPNHIVITGDAAHVSREHLAVERVDMLFFDCHAYEPQMKLLFRLTAESLVDDSTVIALHDTNTHPKKFVKWAYQIPDGWIHQAVERRMVNELHRAGYDAFCLHPKPQRHDESLPFRHGLTLMRKFSRLGV